MFASDTSNEQKHLDLLESGIRKGGLRDVLTSLVGVGIGMLALAYVARLASAGHFGVLALVALAIGLPAGWFGAKSARRAFAWFLQPKATPVYQAVATNPAQVTRFHGIKGARHAVVVDLSGEAGYHEIPIAAEDIQTMLAFLRMRCPHVKG